MTTNTSNADKFAKVFYNGVTCKVCKKPMEKDDVETVYRIRDFHAPYLGMEAVLIATSSVENADYVHKQCAKRFLASWENEKYIQQWKDFVYRLGNP